ncbi:YuzB family protein [Paenibacillus sp. NEAU-GSW1]|uniref:YuzB family protein n=1 Tax=Paenibacillus sp. NEAU-GSW1 TaxID=2682486 RepID=UPI0012E1895F|nr:YuzB family protein [Paenibacillus sp. NEAU-GSW1]MUT68533.1 DUF1450 domain-containing protein [Paenibacillus sp. NEAU-GSW1]
MSKPLIEFCAGNMHHDGAQKLLKQFEQNEQYRVIEYGCLGNCGECYLRPFALVDGQIVAAETADELREKVQAAI